MFSFLIFTGKGVLCNQITQTPSALTAEMGNQAKIFCNYATTYSDPDLYWYHQLSDNTLQSILYRDNSRSWDAEFTKGRFAVERDLAGKTFHLVISPVGSEDAASYYYAFVSIGYSHKSSRRGTNPVCCPALRIQPMS
uniref:T cell receptor delta variable 3 n=1 Tax=Gopherus evgoodei TaxID=1825980 RepID=A0A8C4WSA0_9SAUR